MKNFIVKIILYFFSLVVIITVISFFYNQKHKSIGHEIDKFLMVPNGIKICNLGSSHGKRDYNYDDIKDEYTCFNFGISSQSLSYDERIVETYYDKIDRGGVVIIPISYFSILGINETDASNFKKKNARYYLFLPPEKIKKYSFIQDIRVNYFKSLDGEPLHIIKQILNLEVDTPFYNSYEEIYDVVNQENIDENAYAAAERHIVADKRDTNGNIILNQEEIQSIFEIVRLCKNKEITPILVTSPFTRTYLEKINEIDEEFYTEFYDCVYTISDEVGVEYFDYSHDERFIDDYTLFYDADHMNTVGAKKFTNLLYQEVIKERLIDY